MVPPNDSHINYVQHEKTFTEHDQRIKVLETQHKELCEKFDEMSRKMEEMDYSNDKRIDALKIDVLKAQNENLKGMSVLNDKITALSVEQTAAVTGLRTDILKGQLNTNKWLIGLLIGIIMTLITTAVSIYLAIM